MVSQQDIEDFQRDGAVCLRGVFSDWVERLLQGLGNNIENPSERSRIWNKDADGNVCFYDSQVWRQIEEYRDFALNSPCGELAAGLMKSNRVNFFFDAIFVRTPGTQFRTPFHQDEPYWSVSGFDTCSVWMPLVPVSKESALELVRGSHLWNKRFRQQNFGALTGHERDQVRFEGETWEPFPDIEGERERYEILSWDMQPGDAVFFNGRTIHGGSGKLPSGQDLKVFNTKWLGDDVRVLFRPEGMDPDHSDMMKELGLASGDRVSGELYPEVWSRGSSEMALA